MTEELEEKSSVGYNCNGRRTPQRFSNIGVSQVGELRLHNGKATNTGGESRNRSTGNMTGDEMTFDRRDRLDPSDVCF